MTAEQILGEIKKYEIEFAEIHSRFKRNRDGIWIGEGDDPILRQYVREIIDLFNEVFGKNNYSIQISAPLPSDYHQFFGMPFDIRSLFVDLLRHPEKFPAAYAQMEEKFKQQAAEQRRGKK